jgi:hypothetical protein
MTPATEKILHQAMSLSDAEKREVINSLSASLSEDSTIPEPTWTDEEIAEFMRHEPRSTKTIVEDGLFGAWKDLPGTVDGVEWQDEQRRKRLEKHRW